MVVSTQLDNVLVEQNHCQGLTTVKANCIKLSFLVPVTLCAETYHRPGLTRPLTVHTLRQFPGVIVSEGCDNGLRCLGSHDEEIRTHRRGRPENEGEQVDDAVNGSEQQRMQRGS